MPQDGSLIATMAAGLALAFLAGLLAHRMRLPAIVGYLVAGVAIGPFTPGFTGSTEIARQLAEIGVVLLMFGVGLHFSPADLLAVRKISVPGALAQITVATLLGAGVTRLWGWSLSAGLVFGLTLSVASTVVLLRALQERHALDSINGQIAVGWLVVEDLAMVLALVLLPAAAPLLGGAARQGEPGGLGPLLLELLLAIGKAALFIALIFVGGRIVVRWLLVQVSRTGSRELFTLAILAIALGVAFGSARVFDVSLALGAFFAGLVVSESEVGERAAQEALPLQDAFAVLFFVSVGMLFNPSILVQHPWMLSMSLGVVVVGKSLAALVIVLLFRYPLATALTVAASLSQIGEFSFVLAALGISLDILPPEALTLVVAVSLISIMLNPLMFRLVRPLERGLRTRLGVPASLERPHGELVCPPTGSPWECLKDHVVVIGFGRVGRHIVESLRAREIPFLVVEQNRQRVAELRRQGLPVLYGHAAAPGLLDRANLEEARLLVVTAPDPLHTRQIISLARSVNPGLDVVVRTHSEEEQARFKEEGVDEAIFGEHELAEAMSRAALRALGAPGAGAQEARATAP